jgi:outer membrane lipoprotein-sorting protein
MKITPPKLCVALLLLLCGSRFLVAQNSRLDGWFAAQSGLHTWSADAVQTRNIKSFSQPLVSTGRVWVAAPDRFRWELGQPPQTIAIRQPGQLVLLYPRLKRAEKYPLNANDRGPWRDALALLEASFPRSRSQLESQFKIGAVTETNGVAQVSLQPKSGLARKFMTEILVGFRASDFTPASTELKFSDGSSMRNDFSNSMVNAPLPDSLFQPEIPPDYQVIEPAKN